MLVCFSLSDSVAHAHTHTHTHTTYYWIFNISLGFHEVTPSSSVLSWMLWFFFFYQVVRVATSFFVKSVNIIYSTLLPIHTWENKAQYLWRHSQLHCWPSSTKPPLNYRPHKKSPWFLSGQVCMNRKFLNPQRFPKRHVVMAKVGGGKVSQWYSWLRLCYQKGDSSRIISEDYMHVYVCMYTPVSYTHLTLPTT